MSSIHVSTRIHAPIERVWETVMDPNRFKDWVTIHREVTDVSSHPLRSGSTMRQLLCLRGVNFHVNWKLVDVHEPHKAEWDGKGPAHSRAIIRYQLADDGDGVTAFDYTNEFKAPGGVLGNVASRVIVGGLSEREAHNSLARLKTLLEKD
ncbi:MAG TPA: SRPBCC family protein [Solirubrobacteraceae bacterium]|nr:SRPBCC family protein [Solirubrobacteraceae bacterium]